MPSSSPHIHVAATADGVLTYLVDQSPEALPPVSGRDLQRAWDAAREAATNTAWGAARMFRFRRPDGGTTDLALADPDACCWAGAVDVTTGIGTSYGLSLCLRLLALVDLLAHAPWMRGLFTLGRDGTELHPALLRAVAASPLTAEARLDELRLRGELALLPGPTIRQPGDHTGQPGTCIGETA